MLKKQTDTRLVILRSLPVNWEAYAETDKSPASSESTNQVLLRYCHTPWNRRLQYLYKITNEISLLSYKNSTCGWPWNFPRRVLSIIKKTKWTRDINALENCFNIFSYDLTLSKLDRSALPGSPLHIVTIFVMKRSVLCSMCFVKIFFYSCL